MKARKPLLPPSRTALRLHCLPTQIHLPRPPLPRPHRLLSRLRPLSSPTKEELRSQSKKIKNRRRAFMDKLISGRHYFSDDAMREREPYLHHEYVGKFQDPSGRSLPRPGEQWLETLMRRSKEAILVEKIRRELLRLGVAQRDWVGNERELQEEEEEEEDEGEEEDANSVLENGLLIHCRQSSRKTFLPTIPLSIVLSFVDNVYRVYKFVLSLLAMECDCLCF